MRFLFLLFAFHVCPLWAIMPMGTYGSCKGIQSDPIHLRVMEKEILVNSKPALIYRLVQDDGSTVIRRKQNTCFNLIVDNLADVPTGIHWHGLILPNAEDGVPFVTQKEIPSGASYPYNFQIVQGGTYWAHSHYGLQLQKMMACPLVVEAEEGEQYRDIILFLEDFTFKGIDEVWQGLRKEYVREAKTKGIGWIPAFSQAKMDLPGVHGVEFDAFLTNTRTLEDPDVYLVRPDETIRLRVINGSSASNFQVDLGELPAKIIAVDGNPVDPLSVHDFPIAVAQRVDLLIQIPKKGGAFPALAQREHTDQLTGIILKTEEVKTPHISSKAKSAIGSLSNAIEKKLHAIDPLIPRKVDRYLKASLEGNMQYYVWAINGYAWPNNQPLFVKRGERVEIELRNNSPMAHPIHLHGHFFQILEIDGERFSGALRDTVLVLPKQTIKIQFDANNPGIWSFHCHIIYHLWGGMFTVVQYEDFIPPVFTPQEIIDYSRIYGGY